MMSRTALTVPGTTVDSRRSGRSRNPAMPVAVIRSSVSASAGTTGTGAIRFDQEDQNALWLYKSEGPEATRGFRKILTGPDHPDYLPFCQGPGHGTGYQDQIIIEARDFLTAIETGKPVWPTFRDGLAVMQVIDAAHRSHASKQWITL